MNCTEFHERLDDYLDGLLAEPGRGEMEAHLERCEACRVEAGRLRAILGDTGRLPRSIQPPRDLWPEIRQKIRRRKVVPVGVQRGEGRRLWHRPAVLAAAAVVLMVVSSSATVILMSRRSESPAGTRPGETPGREPPSGVLTAGRTWEDDVIRAVDELSATLEQGRARLRPQTVAILEENLRIINDAVQEARAAVARDPGNPALGQMLWSTYRRKLELLEQAARLVAET